MKKIFLALAAVAALASCVKENTLAPEQTSDNLVTITAVSADTKTVLNGTDVLWQDNDAIKVVLTEDASYKYDIELTTSLDVDANTAEFTFTAEDDENVQKFNSIKADSELDEKGYAIYPSTSAKYLAGFQIIHELPVEQDGTVDPGMNLSSALVTTADIQAGEANAMFNNALTLLQIKVPAGVTSVSLTANYGLAGTLEFNKPGAEGNLSKKSYISEKKTVTLSTGSELDPETVYSLLVYPGNATELTLSMKGLDANDVYEKTISKVLEPSTYYTMDLTKIFNIGVETTLKASSAGDEFVIPVADAADYEYTVLESEDWITAQILETRAFSGKEIVLTVAANDGEAREAQVSIVCPRETRTFTISQEGKAELSFVYVDPEDPESGLIQWEESFGVYSSESDALNETNATKTVSKKTFNIELSDDPEKGTYMITNMFYADSYYDANAQPATGGAKYYADYSDGVLTVKKNDAGNSYHFSGNIDLTYDSVNKIFTAAPIPTTDSKWIGGYTVTVKADDPGAGGDEGSISGDWNQIVTFGSSSAVKTGASASVTVSVSGDQVTLENFVFSGCTATGTLSEKTITISAANADLPTTYGPVDNDIVITLSDDMKTMTASNITTGYGYGIVVDSWTAELPVSLAGDWSQTVTFGSSSAVKTGASASVTVSVSGDQVTLENFVFSGCTATGTLSEKTITISAANADLPTTYGPVDNDIVITLSDDMKTMTASNITTGYGYGIVVDSWTAELP